MVFGSTLLFRFTILHLRTRPVLVKIPHGYPRCYRTCHLLGFVGCFIPIRSGRVPPASLLQRFLKKDDFGCWMKGLKCVHFFGLLFMVVLAYLLKSSELRCRATVVGFIKVVRAEKSVAIV